MLKNRINFQLKSKAKKTSLAVFALISFLLFSNQSTAQSEVIDVETFDKIVVSPHIEVIFKKGEKESVSIESITVHMTKLNVNVKNNTLNISLDGAKVVTDTKKENANGYEKKTSIYKGTVVRAIVTYKEVNSLDLRGEERFVFESDINSKKLRLKIYGESQVYFNEVDITNLLVSIYGESYLEIKQGKIETQKFTAYGESKVNTMNVESTETKLTAYGDGTFQFNVSEKLKITSYGEATINYSGNPTLNKGIVIGETKITNVNF
jgi:hypothetical protein